MSPREDVAQELFETIKFGGLDEVYGASKGRSADNKCWEVTFCKARVLDGVIRVYSPKFILVKWQTAFRDMQHKGQEKFTSVNDAKSFLQLSFIRNL